jgi:hypothetical protein
MQGENAGHNRNSHHGKSWWGKRPLSWYEVSRNAGTNKWFKRLLHKIERRISKSKIIEEQEIC